MNVIYVPVGHNSYSCEAESKTGILNEKWDNAEELSLLY